VKRTVRAALMCVGVTLALVGTGCGDNRLDSGELHDKVTAACEKAHKLLLALPSPQSTEQVAPFLTQAATATNQLTVSLKALKPPADSQSSYNLAVQLVGNQAQTFNKAVRQLSKGSDPVIVMRNVAEQSTQSSERERVAWQGLGIEACANR